MMDQFDHIPIESNALREANPHNNGALYVSKPLADLASVPGTTMLGMVQRLMGEENFSLFLEVARMRILSCVVDTNILVNEVRLAAKTGTVPFMIELARVGSLKLFASSRVRDEVSCVLADMAGELGCDLTELLRAWALISPWITFLDTVSLPHATPRIEKLALRDPDDVPTGQLVELLDPDLLLTADRAFAEFGPSFKPGPEHVRNVRLAYRDKAARDALQIHINVGGAIALVAMGSALRAIINVLWKAAGRLPKPLVVLILSALAAVVAHQVLRRRGDSAPRSVDLAPAEPYLGQHALSQFDEKTRAGLNADQTLVEIERPRSPARSAAAYAARVLSRSPGPVNIDWLVKRMQAGGYRPNATSVRRSVRARLRSSPRLFMQVDGNRWALRSRQTPQ